MKSSSKRDTIILDLLLWLIEQLALSVEAKNSLSEITKYKNAIRLVQDYQNKLK